MARKPSPLRMTQQVQLVLEAMLVDPGAETYGAELSRALGIATGTMFRVTARLEAARIITARVETNRPGSAGRARKFYSFAPGGAERARADLARAARMREQIVTRGRAAS